MKTTSDYPKFINTLPHQDKNSLCLLPGKYKSGDDSQNKAVSNFIELMREVPLSKEPKSIWGKETAKSYVTLAKNAIAALPESEQEHSKQLALIALAVDNGIQAKF